MDCRHAGRIALKATRNKQQYTTVARTQSKSNFAVIGPFEMGNVAKEIAASISFVWNKGLQVEKWVLP